MDLVYPAEELESSRLRLKRLQTDMVTEMFDAIAADRARLNHFLPWAHWMNEGADGLKYVNESIKSWMAGEIFNFGIYRKSDRKYLGNCGGHNISWDNRKIELGYWLIKDGEGQGLMTEAVQLVEEEFFRIGFHRIEIRCDPKNLRSASIPQRLNYQFEGTLRDNLFSAEKFWHTSVFAKLSTDRNKN